ncbi:hypothetical protein Sjap_012078 [Stephania japonica]|uniref:Uncharacterized protein n=1 Tax=Stephania japonica TaxID=461633 RepID=A0AAP0IXQ2_9MAGN
MVAGAQQACKGHVIGRDPIRLHLNKCRDGKATVPMRGVYINQGAPGHNVSVSHLIKQLACIIGAPAFSIHVDHRICQRNHASRIKKAGFVNEAVQGFG